MTTMKLLKSRPKDNQDNSPEEILVLDVVEVAGAVVWDGKTVSWVDSDFYRSVP
jgi:hypothetical protein